MPKSLGGSDEDNNLGLACHRCNERHYNFTTGIDSKTHETVPLFNPRLQRWAEHFIWTADGLKILGVTKVGRATSTKFDFNDENHDAAIVDARWFWVQSGWHPPSNDPIQTND